MGYDGEKLVTREPQEREGCPVCDGGDGPPCSEECDALVRRAEGRRRAVRLREAARSALALARRYRAEGGSADPRIGPVLEQVKAWRRAARLSLVLSRFPVLA